MLKGLFNTPKVQRRKDEARRRANDSYREDDNNYQHQNNRSGSISPPGKGGGRGRADDYHNQSVSPSAISGRSDYDNVSQFKHLEELITSKACETNTHIKELKTQIQNQSKDIQHLNNTIHTLREKVLEVEKKMTTKQSATNQSGDDQTKLRIQRKDEQINDHEKTISSLNQIILEMQKKASSGQPIGVPTASKSSTTPPRLTKSLSKATGAQFSVPPRTQPALPSPTTKPVAAPIPTTRSHMANQVLLL